MKTINKTEYTVQTLTEQHIKPVIDLFTKTFCDYEPTTKYLNIRYPDYEPFTSEVVHKAAKEGMSKVILNKQNRVIAFAIAEDLTDPFIPHLAHYPKLKPVFTMLSALAKPFFKDKKLLRGKMVHVWIVAVELAYRGQGLSHVVNMACIDTAARKGYDFAYAEMTNEISENIIHQFNILKQINKINYDDFTMDGQKPFKGLKGAATAYIVGIRPGITLNSLPNCYQIRERINSND